MKLVGNKLIIDNYETNESEIVSYFSEIGSCNLEERFELSLKIGSMALKTIGTTEKIDYIQKEFARLEKIYDEALTKTFGDIDTKIEEVFGEKGQLTESLVDYFGEEGKVSSLMDENFGEKGKVPIIIKEQFGEDGKLVKDVFSPTRPGTPLFQLKSMLSEEITQLRKDLNVKKAVDEVIDTTPKKGPKFEDECEVWLEDIVGKHTGYRLINTTQKEGAVKSSKKGDFVVTISEIPETRIVLETKDLKNKITLPEIFNELTGAIQNRAASYGIFVCKWKEAMPNSVGCFNEYEGKYLVCALTSKDHEGEPHPEILNMAIGWARNRLLMNLMKPDDLDVNLIRNKMEEIRMRISKFSLIEADCTSAENAIGNVRKHAAEIKDGIEKQIDEISKELTRKSIPKIDYNTSVSLEDTTFQKQNT